MKIIGSFFIVSVLVGCGETEWNRSSSEVAGAKVSGTTGGVDAGGSTGAGGGATGTGGSVASGAGGSGGDGGGAAGSWGSSAGTGGMAGAAPELVDPLEGPSWSGGASPSCAPDASGFADTFRALWSDERGVFALSPGSISLHDKAGWSEVFDTELSPGLTSLTGFVQGPLLGWGGAGCSLQLIEGGQASCSAAVSNVYDVHVVHDQLAYAVYGDRVLMYDGTYWVQYGSRLEPEGTATRSVWASNQSLAVVAAAGQVYLWRENAGPERFDLGDFDIWTVWQLSLTQLWVGGDGGRLHRFDGRQWQLVWTQPDAERIRHMWGSDDTLYFATAHVLYRAREAEVEALGSVGAARISGLWGNGVREVFLAVDTSFGTLGTCEGGAVLWFDGERFGLL
jgi:hypothetical protein